MATGYAKSTATLTATAQRLSAVLLAEGYSGSMLGKYLLITNQTGAVMYYGADSGVNSANGVPIPSSGGRLERIAESPEALIDAGGLWLIAPGGTADVELTWEPA